MRVDPPAAFLLDANILSLARSLKLSVPALVGCPSAQIAVPLVALDECLLTTSPTHLTADAPRVTWSGGKM